MFSVKSVLSTLRRNKGIVFFSLTIIFWSIVFFLIWSRMLVLEKDGLYAGWVNVWGDWSSHISYTTYLATQNIFPPQFPILSGHVLSYPFGADFVSAVLLRLGVSLVPAMLIPSFLLSLGVVVTLFRFYKHLLVFPRAAALGVFLFLFNGGLGFLWFLSDLHLGGWGIISRLPREYTHIEQPANIEWLNIITSELVPQRGFLLGLPIALLILTFLWQIYRGSIKTRLLHIFVAGSATGLLTIIHMHSFLVVSSVALWTFFLITLREKSLKVALWYFIPQAVLAATIIQVFFPQLGASFTAFNPGWLAVQTREGQLLFENMNGFAILGNSIIFWIKNAGIMLFLPVVYAVWIFLMMKKKSDSRHLLIWSLPLFGIFIIANLWTFQPYTWDNTKFLTYWWVAASGFGALLLDRLLSGNFGLRFASIILFFFAIFAGALDVLQITQYDQQKLRMLSQEDLELAAWVKKQTPKDSIFLTADNHDNPIAMLTGRSVVLGFQGWLWTFGIDTGKRQAQVESIYAGRDANTLLSILDVNYVVIGSKERIRYSDLNEEFFETGYPMVYQLGETRIFTVP